MLDFTRVRNREITVNELCVGLTPADLRGLSDEMMDVMLGLIAGCTDADVAFMPEDPAAYDKYAATPEELRVAWTLGHVIVHTTASAEECAFLAAELARGVSERGGRSRSEAPWQTVTTIAQCRNGLEESRRMRLASLDLWPDVPHLEAAYRFRPDGPAFGAVALFVYGLFHDDSHLGQIAEIARQAKAARAWMKGLN
jgi:hypothetical protein